MNDPAFLNISEAAHYLAIGKSKLNELLAAGELRRVKLGRRTLVKVTDLKAFADKLAA